MPDQIKILEQRIAELEEQLKKFSGGSKVDIDPREMEVFKKVGNQLGYDFIDDCGVNECQPIIRFRKRPWWWYWEIPRPVPTYECVPTWPCNPMGNYGRGFDRFNAFGQ